jgi:uncharacterized protein (TIGR03435 family)
VRAVGTIFVLACLFLACLAHGQVFEAASVKPAAPGRSTMTGGPGTSDPTRWACTNVDLFNLTLNAYDLKAYQLIAPSWAADTRVDIAATLPKGATRAELKVMLKKLLEERFRLAAHIDQREMPLYELVTGKDGLKLTKAEAAGSVPDSTGGVDREGYPIIAGGTGYRVVDYRARWQMKRQSMDLIARFLSNQIGRPVIDRTGLTDSYALTLSFIVETPPSVDPPFGPSIFKAVQDQLGLRLEPKKGMVEVMIVDHLEKIPTENQ